MWKPGEKGWLTGDGRGGRTWSRFKSWLPSIHQAPSDTHNTTLHVLVHRSKASQQPPTCWAGHVLVRKTGRVHYGMLSGFPSSTRGTRCSAPPPPHLTPAYQPKVSPVITRCPREEQLRATERGLRAQCINLACGA